MEWLSGLHLDRIARLSALAFAVASVTPPSAANAEAKFVSPPATTFPVAPAVDHHQHLWSQSAFAVTTTPSLPAVELPAELMALIAAHRSTGNEANLRSLYSEDVVLLDAGSGDWIKGRPAVIVVIRRAFAKREPIPISFRLDGTGGFLALSLAERTPGATLHRISALLSLHRDGRRWRVDAATLSPQPHRVAPEEATADMLVAAMNTAGVRRAVVLSSGYWFANVAVAAEAPDERVRVVAENDWAAGEVSRHPDRLIGFCGVNPLRSYALDEIARCAAKPGIRGLKLHFANSGVNLLDARHVERVRRVFAAADDAGLAILLHAWVPGGTYGAKNSEVLLREILPAAPHVTVQIAHLTGTGPGYFPSTDAAIAVFADAIKSGDARVRNLYFDVSSNVTAAQPDETLATIARRLRQIGLDRILFGSDAPLTSKDAIATAWRDFRRLPLEEAEFEVVARNVAPYLR